MRRILFVVLALCSVGQAQGIHVMFTGLTKEQAPLFGSRFEELIRQKLTISQDVTLVDYIETERLVDKLGLRNYPAVSQNLVRQLHRFSQDSTLLVWGRIENYTVEAKRKGIFRAQVVGSVTVALTLYSLHAEKYMFVGNLEASTDVHKPAAWFRRASLVTHISARDQEVIADDLSRQTSQRAVAIISAVVRSFLAQTEYEEEAQQQQQEDLFDVFEVPNQEVAPQEQPQESEPTPQELEMPPEQNNDLFDGLPALE